MRRAMARTLCRLAQTSEGLAAQAARPAAIGLLGAVETATKAAAAVPVRTVSTSAPSFAAETEYSNAVFYPEPEVEVGEAAPAFSLPAIVNGEVKQVSLDDYKGKYVILFFYPRTSHAGVSLQFVCPTEIIAFSDRAKEFEALNCQLLAASTDTPEVHLAWIKTARKRGGLGFMQIPILADVTKAVSARYGVLKRDAGIALRGLYIINPEGVLEHITVNNFPIGRNVDEALRMLQAIQYVAEHGEVCPAGWKPGEKTMVADPEKSLDYFSTVGGDEEEEKESGKLLKIRTKKDLDALVQSGKKAVIKFWAPWCNKCRMIAPHVEELADKHKGVTVASFDTTADELETLTAELGVKGLPQFRFYKDGKETMDKIMGYKLAPLSEAFAKLDKL